MTLTHRELVTEPCARPEIRAVVVAGDRVQAGLAPEWRQTAPSPGSWPADVEGARVDLVLVESGDDPLPGWYVDGTTRTAEPELVALLAWAESAAVPRVLWSTSLGIGAVERDRDLADLVDVVATVDQATVTAWQVDRATPVVQLGPAAQPRLHHPAVHGGRSAQKRRPYLVELVLDEEADLTAGAQERLDTVVTGALGIGVTVWQRLVRGASGVPALPQAFLERTQGPEPYLRLSGVHAWHRVALDLVERGRSVPTWRLLEAGSAQTAVVGTPYSDGLDPALAEAMSVSDEPVAYNRQARANAEQFELRDRSALRLHRAVLAGHTYGHRVDAVLGAIGRATPRPDQSISAVVPTNRLHELDNVFHNTARQTHEALELVLVLHGLDVDPAAVEARAHAAGVERVVVVTAAPEQTLGACMNLGIDGATGRYIAKMDDDNHYGAHYLSDLVRAFDWTSARVVGKWAHYVWLESSEAVVLRFPSYEHSYHRLVQGGTMLIDGDLARTLRFSDLPRGVDTDFLTRAREAGADIYSTDRFNFVSVRRSSTDGHTWKITDEQLLVGSARLAFFGDPRFHVTV